MAMQWPASRVPLALAFFIALSSACGGGDDETAPATSETIPGPVVPEPPDGRSLVAEGSVEITPASGEPGSATIATKNVSNDIYNGKESGYELRMNCGDTVADVVIVLYFGFDGETHVVERRDDRWTVDRKAAQVVATKTTATDADAGDQGPDGGADAGVDSGIAPVDDPSFIGGVGLPGVDARREIHISLLAEGVRYDIDATIPWLASGAPSVCQKPNSSTTTSSSSGGGCGSGSSKRRSHGGDWD